MTIKTTKKAWFDGRSAAACRRRVRGDKGRLLQREVAAAVGVARWTVIAWERGEWPPSQAHFEALVRLYRCDPEELVCKGEITPWSAPIA